MTNGGITPSGSFPASENILGKRELIVIAKSEVGLRATTDGVVSATTADVSPLSELLVTEGISLEPLFGISEERLIQEAASISSEEGIEIPDLSIFYYVDAPDERLDDLAQRLQLQDAIETAFVKPPVELAIAPLEIPELTKDLILPVDEAPAATPNFVDRQGYLNAAPTGVDARYAWTVAGGKGANVNVIDLEWGWRFTHEDLRLNQGGVLAGNNSSNSNHGTAVIGEIGGDENSFGVTGIAPDARVSAISFTTIPSASAIRQAADQLRPGDIMLLEIHRAGPRFNFQGRDDQQGYVAIEWWPDDYAAIRYASSRGIIVVEAAGNGRENLNDAIYDTNPSAPFGPFPSWWRNPYRRNPLDSGAVVVGAGAPPPGTHGRDHGPDRSRLDFSNYGSLIDAQGWGREVTTTGYGDLWRDPDDVNNRDKWYTDTFSGTSSASPIVVGALGSVQGVLRAYGRIPLSPARARELLRSTGSPQQDAPGRPVSQRIGNRPNLRQLIPKALENAYWVGVQFTGTVGAGQTNRWFTFNWPAHWHVIWTVVPTTPRSGSPQIKWQVQVERASDSYITYWINITNVSSEAVNIEARFAVLGW
jgi:Subtilase family